MLNPTSNSAIYSAKLRRGNGGTALSALSSRTYWEASGFRQGLAYSSNFQPTPVAEDCVHRGPRPIGIPGPAWAEREPQGAGPERSGAMSRMRCSRLRRRIGQVGEVSCFARPIDAI